MIVKLKKPLLSIPLLFCLLLPSCKKADEPKNETTTSINIKDISNSPVNASGEHINLQSEHEQANKNGWEIKEPELIWERKFEQPLSEISDINGGGNYIAIQGGREDQQTKLLFLDENGKTVREIPLRGKEKRQIPPEQIWLTHYGEQYRDEQFKKSFSQAKEIETIVEKAYISGNGEYYAILTRDTAEYPAGPEMDTYFSSWYEFAFYNRTGKLLWKIVPQDNYGFKEAYISHDGNRIILINEALLDYFGQSWYVYDNSGKLLKTEDRFLHGLSQEEIQKVKADYIQAIRISKNGKYIAINGPYDTPNKVKLLTGNGELIWQKSFERVALRDMSENGDILLKDNSKDLGFISLDKKGNLLWRTGLGSSGAFLSDDGKYALKLHSPADPITRRFLGFDILYVFENLNGKLLFEATPDRVLLDSQKMHFVVTSQKFINDSLLISYIESPGGPGKEKILALLDIPQKKTVWTKKEIGGDLIITKRGELLVHSGTKIFVFKLN